MKQSPFLFVLLLTIASHVAFGSSSYLSWNNHDKNAITAKSNFRQRRSLISSSSIETRHLQSNSSNRTYYYTTTAFGIRNDSATLGNPMKGLARSPLIGKNRRTDVAYTLEHYYLRFDSIVRYVFFNSIRFSFCFDSFSV